MHVQLSGVFYGNALYERWRRAWCTHDVEHRAPCLPVWMQIDALLKMMRITSAAVRRGPMRVVINR